MKAEPIQAILTQYKPWEACNKPGEDQVRTTLEYVFFEDGYAYASNAHILARVPLKSISTLDDDSLALFDGHALHGPLMKYLAGLWPLRVEKETITNEKGEETEKIYIYAEHGDNEVRVALTNPDQVRSPKFGERRLRSIAEAESLMAQLNVVTVE